jgi:enamidase
MLVLAGGKIIDGTGREPLDGASIVVDGGRIVGVGSDVSYPAGAKAVDLRGLTVMPGLIDCHLHLGGPVADKPGRAIGRISFLDFASFLWDYVRGYSRRRALAIANGVTTVRSTADIHPHMTKLRDKVANGRLTGPRLLTSGPIFTAPGGYPAGTIYRRNRYLVEHATRQVSDAGTAREEVGRLAEDGVDCIKAAYSDSDTMNPGHRVPRLDPDVLAEIVAEAHRRGLRVMVHTGSPDETRDAVLIGADSIEHGILPGTDTVELGDDTIEAMLARGTYFVPTLAVAEAYREMAPEVFSGAGAIVKQLSDAAVNIALGTDSGAPGVVIGRAVHREMELMVEAGLSPMQAIQAGTRNAAANVDMREQLGTIEEGKLAGMIAVRGDPLSKIGDTRNICFVMKNGDVLVDRLAG